jgi:hypothetical protein
MKNLFLSVSIVSVLFMSCDDKDTNSKIDDLMLVTTSNTTGKASFTNISDTNPVSNNLTLSGTDFDGAYFNNDTDKLIVASRTNNRLETYGGVNDALNGGSTSLTLEFFSGSDFDSPREIAVTEDKVIVTQDQSLANGNVSKILVYQKTETSFSLLNEYVVDFKVWGIHIEGQNLYAVADLTSDLVVFNNFFSNANGPITASKRVSIEGLVRTHGLTYSSRDNVMVLTDIGNPLLDNDGAIVVINSFTDVLAATSNLGTIALSNQIKISGSNTHLGNPVDVSYDNVSGNIFVAERLFSGGQVLTFDKPLVSGNQIPAVSRSEAGVSSVFIYRVQN